MKRNFLLLFLFAKKISIKYNIDKHNKNIKNVFDKEKLEMS